jgi:hypothetical protein
MVSAINISTVRHEIAVSPQLRSVLPQEPLDRGRACLVRPDMNVANALCHAVSFRVLIVNQGESEQIC